MVENWAKPINRHLVSSFSQKVGSLWGPGTPQATTTMWFHALRIVYWGPPTEDHPLNNTHWGTLTKEHSLRNTHWGPLRTTHWEPLRKAYFRSVYKLSNKMADVLWFMLSSVLPWVTAGKLLWKPKSLVLTSRLLVICLSHNWLNIYSSVRVYELKPVCRGFKGPNTYMSLANISVWGRKLASFSQTTRARKQKQRLSKFLQKIGCI